MTEPTLGQTIKKIRTDRDLSLHALANRSGISKSFLWEVEQDRSDISVQRLFALADALTVSADKLLVRNAVKQEPEITRPMLNAAKRVDSTDETHESDGITTLFYCDHGEEECLGGWEKTWDPESLYYFEFSDKFGIFLCPPCADTVTVHDVTLDDVLIEIDRPNELAERIEDLTLMGA